MTDDRDHEPEPGGDAPPAPPCADPPHAGVLPLPCPLTWSGAECARCDLCGRVFQRQGGALVWVSDTFTLRLADRLFEAEFEAQRLQAGVGHGEVASLLDENCRPAT